MNIESIARVGHEANLVVQILNGESPSPHWEDLQFDEKASSVEGVMKALNGYGPRELHESWSEFKTKNGWVYGPEKDFEKKTHPCLVPYDDLPYEQKLKDAVFGSIVRALANVQDDV